MKIKLETINKFLRAFGLVLVASFSDSGRPTTLEITTLREWEGRPKIRFYASSIPDITNHMTS